MTLRNLTKSVVTGVALLQATAAAGSTGVKEQGVGGKSDERGVAREVVVVEAPSQKENVWMNVGGGVAVGCLATLAVLQFRDLRRRILLEKQQPDRDLGR